MGLEAPLILGLEGLALLCPAVVEPLDSDRVVTMFPKIASVFVVFFYEGLGELFEARTARAVAAWVAMLLQPGRVDAEPSKEIGELSSIHCCCVE